MQTLLTVLKYSCLSLSIFSIVVFVVSIPPLTPRPQCQQRFGTAAVDGGGWCEVMVMINDKQRVILWSPPAPSMIIIVITANEQRDHSGAFALPGEIKNEQCSSKGGWVKYGCVHCLLRTRLAAT